jgi:hypothetical protein
MGLHNIRSILPVAVIGNRPSALALPETPIVLAERGAHQAWREGQWRQSFSTVASRMRYRSGWYVVDDAPQILFAMDIHDQNLFVDAANRIVIAKFSSLNDPVDHRAIWLTHKTVAEITSCVLAGGAARTTAAE